jgi:hypothetical protein
MRQSDSSIEMLLKRYNIKFKIMYYGLSLLENSKCNGVAVCNIFATSYNWKIG